MRINFKDRNCPICKSPATNISEINPDIDPNNDEQIIKKYWSGIYKDNI